MNKKDLDRGYTDTGPIPEIGDNVMAPNQEKMEEMRWMKRYGFEVESSFGDGGFLDRDCNGMER